MYAPENAVAKNGMNTMIVVEMMYDVDNMIGHHSGLYTFLTNEQRSVYHITPSIVYRTFYFSIAQFLRKQVKS